MPATKPPSPTTRATPRRISILGRALLYMNDLIRAEHFLRQAAALAPNDAQVRSRLARALVELGRQDEALAEMLWSVELDPDSAEMRNDAGAVYAVIGDFDSAREYYRAALALDPGYAKAALNLAKSKRYSAQQDDDEDRIRAAAGHGTADGDTQRDLHLALGKIHDDRGECDVAFAHYERANRPFAEAGAEQVDGWLALMGQMRGRFRRGLVRNASTRVGRRSYPRVHRGHAALGHHAGRAMPGCAPRRARGGRAERHSAAHRRGHRFARGQAGFRRCSEGRVPRSAPTHSIRSASAS